MIAEDWREGGFGVYVHWPFCKAKCPYCDFNSHVWAQIDQARWRRALIAELRAAYAQAPDRKAQTVFFGGGTPSLMEPETVAAIITEIGALWGLDENAEITLEANPTSVEAGRFKAYAQAGVTRVSMGVQALRDKDLRALGRQHTVAEARAAFDVARAHFGRVSFDLIYARMGQQPQDWRAELSQALEMAVDHLSLYQLTIEEGTPFAQLYRAGKITTPADPASAQMYEITQELCEKAGMPAYEVSNHAAPGAQSRHNLVYWRYGDYAGVGPGAHGRITRPNARFALETIRDPAAWLAAVEANGEAARPPQALSLEEQAAEMLMMGLRLREGVRLARYEALAGAPLSKDALGALQAGGFIRIADGRVAATSKGRMVLNAILRELLV